MASQRQSEQPVKEATIRALLDRYNCPTPFHAVRTRFLGDLANPDPTVSPIDSVKALWGGELPTFDSIEAANELLAACRTELRGEAVCEWDLVKKHDTGVQKIEVKRACGPIKRTAGQTSA